jgi:hypothetical protein
LNRQQRRQKKKEGVQPKKEPVINIKYSDLVKIKKEAAKEAGEIALLLMLSIPVTVLHDKWGFGKVRIDRFTDQVLDLYDSFEKDYVTLEDLQQCLLEEAGITIERKKP